MDFVSVNKIDSAYVSDDCIQYMEPFKSDYLTVIGDGIQYHQSQDDVINDYLEDSRRFDFPYFTIPMHVEKNLFGKFNYVNQLYDFGKKYFVCKDGNVFCNSAFKMENGEGIIIRELLNPMFSGNDKFYINFVDMCDFVSSTIPDDSVVLSDYGRIVKRSKAAVNILGMDESSIIYFKPNQEGFKASGIKIYRNDKLFDVILFDMPETDFSLEDAKYLYDYAPYAHKPKVKRRHNPSYDKDTILRAKSMEDILSK